MLDLAGSRRRPTVRTGEETEFTHKLREVPSIRQAYATHLRKSAQPNQILEPPNRIARKQWRTSDGPIQQPPCNAALPVALDFAS